LKNHRNYFQKLLLDGFFLDHDALLWIPSLEALSSNEWETIIPREDALRTVGTMSIAKLAIAAVEQYAGQRKLIEGSVEKIRAIAAILFFEMSNKTALVNGKCLILGELRNDFPEIIDWTGSNLDDLTAAAKIVRSETAGKALGILRMIEEQQQPKKRGNQGERPKGFMSDAAAKLYDLAISEVINITAQMVKARSPLKPATAQMIRPEIRQVVKGAVVLGLFIDDPEYDDQGEGKNLGGLVDVITRKALRRFDSDNSRFVREGKLIIPSKPEKKKSNF
jgi:hypothetical protein